MGEPSVTFSSDELAFFKQTTGITEEEDLKQHVRIIQAQALAVFHYPCISRYTFTRLKISRLPAYPKVLQLIEDKPDALLLDIACCFGTDTRKVVVDGYPAANVIASDLHPEFWDLGHKLFRDTPESFPAAFVAGDIFDPAFLSPTPDSSPETVTALKDLTNLTPLKSRISTIHATNFFHLFDKAQQAKLAGLLASLLSPVAGSIVFGSHIGAPTSAADDTGHKWAHSPESWKSLWESVFGRERCKVHCYLREAPSWVGKLGRGTHLLIWSVEVQ